MAKSRAIFRQTQGVQSPRHQSGRSSDAEYLRPRDQFFVPVRFRRCAAQLSRLREWSQADAPATVTHQIWLLRCGRARSREPESGSSRGESLQFLWQLSDKLFDFLCVVAVTKQKRVFCPHNDKIVDSK